MQTSGAKRRGNAKLHPRDCERSDLSAVARRAKAEAIHLPRAETWIERLRSRLRNRDAFNAMDMEIWSRHTQPCRNVI
jgi:hypothetical protein